MITPHDRSAAATRSTALALIAQYGGDASTIAMLKAAELAAMGDVDGLAQWDEIIAFILLLEEDGPAAGVTH
jgi:hypothetical protein